MDVAIGQCCCPAGCYRWLLRMVSSQDNCMHSFGIQVVHTILSAVYQEIGLKSADIFKTGSCCPEALLIYIVWGCGPLILLSAKIWLLHSIFSAWRHCCRMLWSNMNISVSSIKNAVYTVFSNSFSRGRVQDFSPTWSAVFVFGEGFGVFMLSFWGLLGVSWIIPFICNVAERLCWELNWELQPGFASKWS